MNCSSSIIVILAIKMMMHENTIGFLKTLLLKTMMKKSTNKKFVLFIFSDIAKPNFWLIILRHQRKLFLRNALLCKISRSFYNVMTTLQEIINFLKSFDFQIVICYKICIMYKWVYFFKLLN